MSAEALGDEGKAYGRRQFARFPVSVLLTARAPELGGQEIRGLLRNVGGGGLMVEFRVAMTPGGAVTLLLHTRRGPVIVEGRVVWTASADGKIRHGIAFHEPKGQGFAVDLFVAESRFERPT
jgi:hypothetical protein